MADEKEFEDFELDLDVLAPQARYIKLVGERVAVYPPKFINLVELMKLVKKFDKITANTADEEVLAVISEIKERLVPVMPRIIEPKFDLSIEQLNALIQYIFKIAQPTDTAMLKKAGYNMEQDAQKKTPQEPLN